MSNEAAMRLWLGSILVGIAGIIILIWWLGTIQKMTAKTQDIRNQVMCICLMGIFGGGTMALLQLWLQVLNPNGVLYAVLSGISSIILAGLAGAAAFASYMTGHWRKPLARLSRHFSPPNRGLKLLN